MKKECNGKNECVYDFSADQFPNGIVCKAENTQLISTYYCVDEGDACPV